MGPVYRDLELERYGARYVFPENQFAHVFPDGRAIVCSRSVDRTAASIARFSKADAETFRELAHAYREVLEQGFIPAMFSPPVPPSQESGPLEDTTEGLTMLRHFLSTPNHVARDLFESPEAQTWLGFWVAQLAGTGDVFGLGANYPVMLAGSLEPYGWGICVGGSNVLAQAMVRFLEEHGGEVRLDSPVARIEVGGGIARAVELEDGTRIPVSGVLVSNLDPKVTFLELVGEEELDAGFAHACRRWRYDAMSMFCVYLALDEPVRWKAAEWDEARRPVLRRLALRVARRPRRQRLRLPPGHPAAAARPLHRPPVALRAEPLPAGEGGGLLRADRAVGAARRRARGVGGGEGGVRRERARPLARARSCRASSGSWAATSPARSTSNGACRACGTATGITAR